MKTFKKILTGVLLVLTFAVVILLVFTRIQGNTPSIFGYQVLRVVTPSMEPELKVGDVILTKTVDDVTELKAGDVITYIGDSGSYNGKLITHEVVVSPYEVDGEYYLQTQGIANYYPDPEISASQVQSKMICSLPFISAIYNFFMTPWGLVVVLGFLAVLFINEIFSLIRITKEKNPEEECLTEVNSDNEESVSSNSDNSKSDLTK